MRLGLFSHDIGSACSFYRGAGPIGALQKENPGIVVNVPSNVNWASLKFIDIAIVQRPMYESSELGLLQLTTCEMIKRNNIPLIIDYDDDLFAIPEHNRVIKQFTNKSPDTVKEEISRVVAACCGFADFITVTNSNLKNALIQNCGKKIKDKIRIIPNAIDDYLLPPCKLHQKEKKEFVIGWRGSDTHKHDMKKFQDQIIEISREFPNYKFLFIGEMPNLKLYNNLENKEHIPPQDIARYYNCMNRLNIDIFMFPLEENAFNLSKSDIGPIEAAYTSAQVVIPEFLQTDLPNVIRYKTDMATALRSAINSMQRPCIEENIKHIVDNRTLSVINQQRLELFNSIMDA